MASSKRGDYSCVVAIDFGTSSSGYAYSFKGSKDEIQIKTNWGAGSAVLSAIKTPTCVLTDKNNKFVAIGYEAMRRFKKMNAEVEDSHRLFEGFKMVLHTKKLNRSVRIKDHRGDDILAIEIFAMVLQQMKINALKEFKEKIHGWSNRHTDGIRWVITVPAIWSDAGKQFMRESAIKAELVTKHTEKNLMFALEPEAASVHCLTIPVSASARQLHSLQVGDKYLVMDSGGGTLDLTAHEVLPGHRLVELDIVNGGPIGSIEVNKNFMDLMDEMFEHKLMRLYQEKLPTEYNEFYDAFEQCKKSFDVLDTDCTQINVCTGLVELYSLEYHKPLSKSIREEYMNRGVTIERGKLCLPHKLMMEMFNPVVDKITTFVNDRLNSKQLNDVNKILMVGGFSDCSVLKAAVKDRFSGKYDVIVSQEGWAAVLKGAVKLGHDSSVIRSRIARKTYGKAVHRPVDLTTDPFNRIEEICGVKYSKDNFEVFVKKGEKLPPDHCVQKPCEPVTMEQTSITVEIFSTFLTDPLYVDEKGVVKLGDLILDLPKSKQPRQIMVKMNFGGPEIKVEAIDVHSGHQVRTELEFMSDGDTD